MNREIKFRAWTGKETKEDFGYIRVSDGVAIDWSEDHYEEWVVMQFTGLKDKNGKEIYEGDIAKEPDEDMATIVYIRDTFMADYKLIPIHYARKLNISHVWEDLEVIGNIYENPELI